MFRKTPPEISRRIFWCNKNLREWKIQHPIKPEVDRKWPYAIVQLAIWNIACTHMLFFEFLFDWYQCYSGLVSLLKEKKFEHRVEKSATVNLNSLKWKNPNRRTLKLAIPLFWPFVGPHRSNLFDYFYDTWLSSTSDLLQAMLVSHLMPYKKLKVVGKCQKQWNMLRICILRGELDSWRLSRRHWKNLVKKPTLRNFYFCWQMVLQIILGVGSMANLSVSIMYVFGDQLTLK